MPVSHQGQLDAICLISNQARCGNSSTHPLGLGQLGAAHHAAPGCWGFGDRALGARDTTALLVPLWGHEDTSRWLRARSVPERGWPCGCRGAASSTHADFTLGSIFSFAFWNSHKHVFLIYFKYNLLANLKRVQVYENVKNLVCFFFFFPAGFFK